MVFLELSSFVWKAQKPYICVAPQKGLPAFVYPGDPDLPATLQMSWKKSGRSVTEIVFVAHWQLIK